MVSLLVKGFKLALFSIFVLVLSQIKIHGTRICDHTAVLLEKASVKHFTKSVSKLIDFTAESSKSVMNSSEERMSATNKKSQIQKNPAHEKISTNEKRDLKKILKSLSP